MSEIKSRADLFEAAAKMMRMCDEAWVPYASKLCGEVSSGWTFTGNLSDYEFPLAILEGKPVFNGDELYDSYGRLVNAEEAKKFDGDDVVSLKTDGRWYRLGSYSWNPPKPKTVMVEISVEDADTFFNSYDQHPHGLHGRIARACCKALEELK